MSGYRRYPKYRDSGVEWIGEVPAGWALTKLKFMGEFLNGYPFNPTQWGKEGLPIIRIAQLTGEPFDNYFNGTIPQKLHVENGDLLFSWSATIDCFIWKRGAALLNQHIFKVNAANEINKYFLYYFIQHVAKKLLEFDAHGSTMHHIKKESLSERVFIPSYFEQTAIASYLNHATARIDALIAKKTRFIELLKEKRQAFITHAVTKGLDPKVKMKDSGVEWIGEVPEHWPIPKLRHIATVQSGVAKGKNLDGQKTITVPYMRVANVQDGYLDLSDVAEIEIPRSELPRYLLRPGDVLMNEGGDNDKLGRGHIWHGEIPRCIHQNHVFAVRPHGVSSEWLNAYAGSVPAQAFFASMAKQATNLASISSNSLMELPVPQPPASEAAAILEYADNATDRIDRLISTTTRSITLLQEKRSALITAAVTGQIDVRDDVRDDVREELAA